MSHIGHGIQDRVVRRVGVPTGLELDFHFKITSTQIKEGFGGQDQKFHRIDHSWVNGAPNIDMSVLGTWNTCNLGLMTRADKL